MKERQLPLPGALVFEAPVFPDERGFFSAPFHAPTFTDAVGYSLTVKQTNLSPTRAGAVRGIHFADVPPGQAKYVYAAHGRLLDIVVDIRVGSPTYGQYVAIELSPNRGVGVFIPVGMGHAVLGLSDDAALSYLCSEAYNPPLEHGICPLDPLINLPFEKWCARYDLGSVENLVLSDKDRTAPSLHELEQLDALPHYDECEAFYSALRQTS